MLWLMIACRGGTPELEFEVPEGTLSGVVTLTATGNFDQLLISVDGAVLAGGEGPGLSADWDTTTVEDGPHVLRASGFEGEDDAIEVIVDVDVAQDGGQVDPPVVTWIRPSDGDTIASGTDTTLTFGVAGDDLVDARVLVDDVLLATLPAEGPYEVTWQDPADGAHTLTAVAQDAAGNTGEADLSVTVGGTMECRITAPPDGADVAGIVELRAAVNSAEGRVQSVAFYAGDTLISTDTASPWQASWDATGASGAVTLSLDAVDDGGNTCGHSVSVTVVDDVAFAVVITAPSDGATVQGTGMPVKAAVQTSLGAAGVSLYADGVLVGDLDAPPWAWTVDSTAWPDGDLVLEVEATELESGAEATDDITVVVDNG